MAHLYQVVVHNPWTPEDQEILEWMFPSLKDYVPYPPTPEPAEAYLPGLYRTYALNREQWCEILDDQRLNNMEEAIAYVF